MASPQKIIIVGAGIGGLLTALRLHQEGFQVKVFESVKEVTPLGVGINLLPHCVRVLTNLGLLDKIHAIAVETQDLVYANRFGQFFWKEPRGRFAGYKWPQFSIHRGHFQVLLWEEAQTVLGSDALFTGCHLLEYKDDGNQVTATFINKETGEVVATETADILIGADGINSVVRKKLYPNEGAVVYSGNVLYRGTSMIYQFLTGATMAMIGSLKQKMVVYPIGKEVNGNGQQLINWVANIKEEAGSQLTVRDWNRRVDNQKLLELYKNWNFNWMNVPEMIENTVGGIFEFPMSDRDPLPRWTFGRVTLLGDAAHPMYPIGSNGASQAILDADALALAMIRESNLPLALEKYDAERVPATTQVVLQNRQKGPDFIMDYMEELFPEGFEDRDIPTDELAKVMSEYKRIAGFDMESLNAKS